MRLMRDFLESNLVSFSKVHACPLTQQSLRDLSRERPPFTHKGFHRGAILSQKQKHQHVITPRLVDPMEPIKDDVCQRSLGILENVYNITLQSM